MTKIYQITKQSKMTFMRKIILIKKNIFRQLWLHYTFSIEDDQWLIVLHQITSSEESFLTEPYPSSNKFNCIEFCSNSTWEYIFLLKYCIYFTSTIKFSILCNCCQKRSNPWPLLPVIWAMGHQAYSLLPTDLGKPPLH